MSRPSTPARSSTPAAALLVADAALTPEWVAATCPRLLNDRARLDAMGAAAADVIPLDADEKLARIILEAGAR